MADKPKRIKIGPLNTVGGVVTELGKVYREARRGELKTQEATRLASILSLIRASIEGADFEERLKELEEKL